MRCLRPFVWFAPLLLIVAVACSRRDGLTELVKTDGSVVVGTVVEARADGVVIKTPSGETLTVPRKDIASMRAVETPAEENADNKATGDETKPPRGGGQNGGSEASGNPSGGSTGGRASGGSDRTVAPPGRGADGSGAGTERISSGAGSAGAASGGAGSSGGGSGSSDASGSPTSRGRGQAGDGRSGSNNVRPPSGPDAREVVVPAGTTLSVALKSAVDSRTSKAEDKVEATLTRPVMVNAVEVLPVGSVVLGSVVDAMPSQRLKGRAYVVVRFERVRTGGFDLPFRSASLRREAASTVKRDAKRTGIGAAIGGAVGAVVGRSKSALGIGAAAGAGVVGADVALTKGEEIRLAPGTPLTIKLSDALTVEVSGR